MAGRRIGALVFMCAALVACASQPPPPPNAETTWAKRGVSLEAFRSDLAACNERARAAGEGVPENTRPLPEVGVAGQFLVMGWRWLTHGVQVDYAMNQAYDACFRPRGYRLVYVREADVLAIHRAPAGDAMNRLHAFSSARQQRASIEMRYRHLPLLTYVYEPMAPARAPAP